ncbi:hypothetical protein [Pseudomonas fluorescens group sp. PF-69]
MIDLRERAEWWGVKPEPLIEALTAAQQVRRYREGQKPLIASTEPADANRRLRQAHKAIAALPLRARAHLHWGLAERIAYGRGLDPEQVRRLMQDTNLVELILDALSEPVEPEEPDRELQGLAQAWERAGGEVEIDDRYDGDLIEYLTIAYEHLGETLTPDAIRLRLDRIRRAPLDS